MQTMKQLEAAVRQQRRLILALAKALYLHARTDVAPDACLPSLKKLIDAAKQRPQRKRRN